MSSAPYAWQQALWDRLSQADLPQALLITGMEGVGKTDFCRALAARSLCAEPEIRQCGVCPSCHQLRAGSHPDYREMSPLEGKRDILIDQVREFCAALQLTSSQSHGRYALIIGADRMTVSAANALLKTLEEPPRSLHILLTASQLSRVPATVRSRCARMHIRTPSESQVQEWLNIHAPEQAGKPYLQRGGPCGLAAADSKNAATHPAKLETHWRRVLEQVSGNQGDVLKAAGEVDDDNCEAFLAWWQYDLLEKIKADPARLPLRRLWDALATVRRQGQGSFNRLLALEGLFILYTQIAAQNQGSRL